MVDDRLPPPDPTHALYLDVDGTLIDLAATPGAVVVPVDLPGALVAAADALGGALAIVSGRPLGQIDALLGWAGRPAAGLHGLELREPGGAVARDRSAEDAVERARPSLAALRGDGVLVEDKGLTIAVHYRLAPTLGDRVRAAAEAAAAASDGVLEALAGAMVVEVRPRARTKGDALARLHAQAPFAGRVPVAVGDDVTDEDAFVAALARRGIAVRVGAGRATPPGAVRAWVAAYGGG